MHKKYCQKSVTKKKKTEPNKSYKNHFTSQLEPNIQLINHQFLNVPDSHSQIQVKEENFQFIGNQTKHLNHYYFSQPDFYSHSQVQNPHFMAASLQDCDSQLRQIEKESRQSFNMKLQKKNSYELTSNKNPEDNVQPITQSSKIKETNEIQIKRQKISFNALFKNKRNNTKQSEVDDYHKNIPLAVFRKARCYFKKDKMMNRTVELKCQKKMVQFSKFKELMDVDIKSNNFSLTWLYYKFMDPEDPVKEIFGWYFKWFAQNRYIDCLLDDSKIKDKAKYIDYVHRYLVNLAQYRLRHKIARSI